MGLSVEYPGATLREQCGDANIRQFSSKLDSPMSNDFELELLIYQVGRDEYCNIIEEEPLPLTVATIQTRDSERHEDRYYFLPDGSFLVHDHQEYQGTEQKEHVTDRSLEKLLELGELLQRMIDDKGLSKVLEEHPTIRMLRSNELKE